MGGIIYTIFFWKPLVIVDERGIELWKQFYPWDAIKKFSKPYGGCCKILFAESVSFTPPKKLKEGIEVDGNQVTISKISNYLVMKEAVEKYGKENST